VGVNHILMDLRELVRVHPSVKDNEFVVQPLKEDALVRINGTEPDTDSA